MAHSFGMRSLQQILIRVWVPVLLVAAWEILARIGILNPIFFPPPSLLLEKTIEISKTGELGGHLGHTLSRTLQGVGIGLVAGVAVGVLMGISQWARRSLEPMVSAFSAAPKIALLPILMLALGIGEAPRVALIAAAAFVMAALPMLDGLRNLDSNYVELARNYGARPWDLITWVYLPGALPNLLTGIRLALSRALGVCVAVEVVNAREGLGSLIWSGWQAFQPEYVYIGVFVAAAVGAVFHASLRTIERIVVRWKPQTAQG
jgi:NitT/TauT family transport system permease protein